MTEKVVEKPPQDREICGKPHSGPDHTSYCDKDKSHVGVTRHHCHYCGQYYD